MKSYKIGEFAKNLGVSAGFLKHHESYGLLHPHTTEAGYRYYDFDQAMLVVQCIRLQSMGFTSKEISDILNHSTLVDVQGAIGRKKVEIRQKLDFYEEMLQYLEELDSRETDMGISGCWSIATPEPFYYMENASGGQFDGNEARYEVAARWNEYMPMVETCTRFERTGSEAGLKAISGWHMGLRITKGVADRLDIFRNEEVRLVEPKKCLIYHSHGDRKRYFSDKERALGLILEKPLAICRQHRFVLNGDIYTVQNFCSTAQDENYVREMVLIPVEG